MTTLARVLSWFTAIGAGVMILVLLAAALSDPGFDDWGVLLLLMTPFVAGAVFWRLVVTWLELRKNRPPPGLNGDR